MRHVVGHRFAERVVDAATVRRIQSFLAFLCDERQILRLRRAPRRGRADADIRVEAPHLPNLIQRRKHQPLDQRRPDVRALDRLRGRLR